MNIKKLSQSPPARIPPLNSSCVLLGKKGKGAPSNLYGGSQGALFDS